MDKVVVDATNPWEDEKVDPYLAPEPSGIDIARALPYVRIAKAFTSITTEALSRSEGCAIPIAGDDSSCVEQVSQLASSMGFTPVHVGGMALAPHVESFSRILRAVGDPWPRSRV